MGPYKVTGELGAGGMGIVLRATDTQLHRDVALKIFPDAFAADPDRLARFQREAQVLASLNHPGIAAIYGIEEDEVEGRRALVLELVEGPTLADRIAERPVPLDEALAIAKQIAEALEAAHEAGVIHRDLKPANIKVREDGTVKVLDFGLAKALDPNPEGDPSQSPTLTAAATQMGVIMGTAAYMSPEQARGKPVDRRADIWAFGCVLYEMLTGRKAFPGDDVSQTLARVIDRDPDWDALPKTLPSALDTYLRRCLQKDPRDRVRDIGDVRLAMKGAFDVSAPAAPTAPGARTQHIQRAAPVAAASALVAALLAGAAVWYVLGQGEGVPRATNRFAVNLPPSVEFQFTTTPVAISRDGRRLVFNGGAGAGEGNQIYLRALEELNPVPVRGTSREGIGIGSLFLSPDGEWVGFNDVSDGTFKRVRVTGGPPATICDRGSGRRRHGHAGAPRAE